MLRYVIDVTWGAYKHTNIGDGRYDSNSGGWFNAFDRWTYDNKGVSEDMREGVREGALEGMRDSVYTGVYTGECIWSNVTIEMCDRKPPIKSPVNERGGKKVWGHRLMVHDKTIEQWDKIKPSKYLRKIWR